MMNVRLKLREPTGFVVPKGPDFRRARTIRSDLDGTHIRFKAPPHRPYIGGEESVRPQRRYRSSFYADGNLPFRSVYDKDEDPKRGLKDHFEKLRLFYHAWAFYGPWFSGSVAELSLSFSLVKAVNFPDSLSLFHPRALEQVIAEYLTYLYSRHLSVTRNYIQEFDAPINWQPLSSLPVNAVRLDAVPREFSAHKTIEHLMFFPISNEVMAVLHFMPSRLLGIPRSELDKRVSAEPLYELMDKIIHSIELTLSPEAQAQQDKALVGMDNTELVKDYAPLKWDDAEPGAEFKYLNESNG